jgi:hypothetical protein
VKPRGGAFPEALSNTWRDLGISGVPADMPVQRDVFLLPPIQPPTPENVILAQPPKIGLPIRRIQILGRLYLPPFFLFYILIPLSRAGSNCWQALLPPLSLSPLVTLPSATQSALYCARRVKIDFACYRGQAGARSSDSAEQEGPAGQLQGGVESGREVSLRQLWTDRAHGFGGHSARTVRCLFTQSGSCHCRRPPGKSDDNAYESWCRI